ncbi:hypothetical protein [Halobacillus litoralis]|uniref:hypothetical protein n=1 Tax=Halobacillus litoralis TaxID=45668 RepID=UPI001CFC7F58|nr:hypothetical protein [Halobacillus litoralis]
MGEEFIEVSIREMTKELAWESLLWRYEAPYDFYDVKADEESLKERLDGNFQAVFENNIYIGFFCTGSHQEYRLEKKQVFIKRTASTWGWVLPPL